MLSLSKLLPSLGSSVNYALRNSVRSIYSANYFGIENFKGYSERYKNENAQNSNVIKQAIKEAVSKPDGKIFTEDLKTYLYNAKTDEEVDTLVEAIKKYLAQQTTSLFPYNFEGSLMRLFYSLNKTDKALSLYLKDESNFFNKSFKVTAMLMNKLLEEKRYDDVIKVGSIYLKLHKSKNATRAPNTQEPVLSLGNVGLLYTEALYGKNDSTALAQAKQFLKDLGELKEMAKNRSISQIVVLALEQKEPEYALEVLKNIGIDIRKDIKGNLKILSLIDLKKADEALNLAEELSNQKPANQDGRQPPLFFRTTLEKLQAAFENDAEKKKRVQTLLDTTTAQNQFYKNDLKEYFTSVVVEKPKLQYNQARGGGGGVGGNNQRAPGQFNRGPNQQRQQFGNDNNRPPRQQGNRFNNDRPRFQQQQQQQQQQDRSRFTQRNQRQQEQ